MYSSLKIVSFKNRFKESTILLRVVLRMSQPTQFWCLVPMSSTPLFKQLTNFFFTIVDDPSMKSSN